MDGEKIFHEELSDGVVAIEAILHATVEEKEERKSHAAKTEAVCHLRYGLQQNRTRS